MFALWAVAVDLVGLDESLVVARQEDEEIRAGEVVDSLVEVSGGGEATYPCRYCDNSDSVKQLATCRGQHASAITSHPTTPYATVRQHLINVAVNSC